jgi:hypothetical protein
MNSLPKRYPWTTSPVEVATLGERTNSEYLTISLTGNDTTIEMVDAAHGVLVEATPNQDSWVLHIWVLPSARDVSVLRLGAAVLRAHNPHPHGFRTARPPHFFGDRQDWATDNRSNAEAVLDAIIAVTSQFLFEHDH